MDRCIIRNDQTAGQVLVEKRELTVRCILYFQQLDRIHSTYRQIINQHWLSMLKQYANVDAKTNQMRNVNETDEQSNQLLRWISLNDC